VVTTSIGVILIGTTREEEGANERKKEMGERKGRIGEQQLKLLYSTLSTAAGLSPGNHSVTITDAAGCYGTASFNITPPPRT
jgi:hypothetical protein